MHQVTALAQLTGIAATLIHVITVAAANELIIRLNKRPSGQTEKKKTNFPEKLNGQILHSAFIQSAVQSMLLIHPFTHQWRLVAMQGTNQLVRSNWGLGILLKDTLTGPGWDRTGNPPIARQLLLPPELVLEVGALQPVAPV